MIEGFFEWLFYGVFGLSASSNIAVVFDFFVYDSLKILVLLFSMITFLGFLRTYISQDKVKKWIGKSHYGLGNIAASLFGAITPFCSCSSIPIFLSFVNSRIPLGVMLSFLITSPLVNEYLVVLMLGFFGLEITLMYVASGIVIGVVSGIILGKLNLERYLEKDIISKELDKKAPKFKSLKERFRYGLDEAVSITKNLWVWILLGVGVGAIIHNYIPQDLIQGFILSSGFFSVPLAVLLGIPMYGSCIAIVPIAAALFAKGIPLGTTLAFMMSISALSLPEAIILRRAMKLRLIGIFFGIVALAIIVTGYFFNLVL